MSSSSLDLDMQCEVFDEVLSDDSDVSENGRLMNTDWCSCGHCSILDTVAECRCCCESERLQDKKDELKPEHHLRCITEHPGFSKVCCSVWVLQVAYYQYIQKYGEIDLDELSVNSKYRFIAYRQFVLWCWGYLVQKLSVPLPACVVSRIKSSLPPEKYASFQYPQL